jgi:hypothetical protein
LHGRYEAVQQDILVRVVVSLFSRLELRVELV